MVIATNNTGHVLFCERKIHSASEVFSAEFCNVPGTFFPSLNASSPRVILRLGKRNRIIFVGPMLDGSPEIPGADLNIRFRIE